MQLNFMLRLKRKNKMTQVKTNEVKLANGLILKDSDFVGETVIFNVTDLDKIIYVAHDHGFVVGACFADHLQDALEILADEHCLDTFEIEFDDDYKEADERISYLGNYGKPYDIETLTIFEMAAPNFSITSLIIFLN